MPHPSSKPKALITTNHLPWHHILGRPFDCIISHLLSLHEIKSNSSPCISCGSVKSHKLPFSTSTIKSKQPLELIYTDVWGLTPTRSFDGFSYYLIFVDHYTKYTWLYMLNNKSNVLILFPKFKSCCREFF